MPAGTPKFAKVVRFKEKYFQSLRDGSSRTTAARQAGVSYELIRQCRNENPVFASEERAAEDEAVGSVEDALVKTARSGNVTAIQVFLYNRSPQRWRDMRTVRHGGADDLPPIGFTVAEAVRQLQQEEAGMTPQRNGTATHHDPV